MRYAEQCDEGKQIETGAHAYVDCESFARRTFTTPKFGHLPPPKKKHLPGGQLPPPFFFPRDCKMHLWAQLCLKNFNQKCMIQAAMNRNIKLCWPLLFLDQLLGHLHDYDALLPSRWPFPPPPSTWCAPWPARQAPPTWCAPWPPCHAPSTWCAPWPPRQAPSPSHPWCPPWAVSRKSQEKCAKKRKKMGVAVVLLANVFFWRCEVFEFGGGKCPNFGGGKCPPGQWLTITRP